MYFNDTNNIFSPSQGLNYTPISAINSLNPNNNFSWGLTNSSSFQPQLDILQNEQVQDEQVIYSNSAVSASGYNSKSGYGLVNAGAAVAASAGQNSSFPDVPNLGGNNWGADTVKAPEAWARGYTGQGVVVAVVDTGVDYNHPDLKDNIWTNPTEIFGNGVDDDGNGYVDDVRGWNFVNNTNEVMDDNEHGSHVSGIIAGKKNDFGVTGIAYDTKIMPLKVLDGSGSGSSASVANGIRYAAKNGANVINLSLGSNSPDREIESAIEYASSQGSIVVMAAGNDSNSQPGYPARYASKYGIAVGAIDKNEQMAYFSNRAGGEQLTYVTAPGVDIYSTVPNNQYASLSGTSMAAPYVAGVVALMLSANPSLNENQVRQILSETSTDSSSGLFPGFDFGFFGHNMPANSNYSQSYSQNYSPNRFNISNNTQSFSLNLRSLESSMGSEELPVSYDGKSYKWSEEREVNQNDVFGNSTLTTQSLYSFQSQPDNNLVASAEDNNPIKLIEEIKQQLEKYRRFLGQ
jgi:subtilisin